MMVIALKAFFSLPLLLFLPGYFSLLAFYHPSKAKVNRVEVWFQAVVFSALLTSVIAVALTYFGVFKLVFLLIGTLFFTVGALVVLSQRDGHQFARFEPLDRSAWSLLVLVVLCSLLFFHPHEFIIGGADAGVYVNQGKSIASTGAWLIFNKEIAALDQSLYPVLFRQQPEVFYSEYEHLPGFYLDQDVPGHIIPQFYALHPIWQAIFYSIGGLRFSLFVTPLWGVLGTLAVYFAARFIFDKRVGFLAALFLTFTAPQIWFSRYQTSEVLTQFLLFSGIYVFTRFLITPSTWLGVLAGVSLGMTTLVRVDMYFLALIPLSYAVWWRLKRQLDLKRWIFIITIVLVFGYSLIWALTRSLPYFVNSYKFASLPVPPFVLVVLGIIAFTVIFIFDRLLVNHPDWWEKMGSYYDKAATILAILVIVLAVYAYFIRPRLADTALTLPNWYGGHNMPNVEPYNFVRFGWYFSPLGIAVAVLGLWWALRCDKKEKLMLLVGIGLFFSLLYFQRTRNNPIHIYVMRRYLPAVFPFFATMAAFAIATLLKRPKFYRWIGGFFAFALAGWLLYNARIVIPHAEYRGVIQQFETLVSELGDNERTLILFNHDVPVGLGPQLGTPLHYLYDYTVFDLREEYVTPSLLNAQIKEWQSAQWRVLVVESDPYREGVLTDVPRSLILDYKLHIPILEASYEHPPREIWESTWSFRVYELAALP